MYSFLLCFFICRLQGFAQIGKFEGKLMPENDTLNASAVKLVLARKYDTEEAAAVSKFFIDTLWVTFIDPGLTLHMLLILTQMKLIDLNKWNCIRYLLCIR